MIWYVIVGFLSAVGLLFLLWLGFGVFSPASAVYQVALVCRGGEKAMLRRYRWMRDLGLTRCRIVIVDSTLSPKEQSEIRQSFPGVTFQTPAQWLDETQERLEKHG